MHSTAALCSPQSLLLSGRQGRSTCCRAHSNGTSPPTQLLTPHLDHHARHVHTITEEELMPRFEVVTERVAHERYLTLLDRRVRITSDITGEVKELDFDIVGHPRCQFQFAVVLPFHPGNSEREPHVTLIREYCQGPNVVAYNLPTGGFEPGKHASMQECAAAELSEEALLKGGDLVRLIPEQHPGFAEVKWCCNRFVPFVAIDPQPDPEPGSRDAEEYIQVVRMGLPEFRQLLVSGDMMLPSIVTANMALKLLEDRGLIPKA